MFSQAYAFTANDQEFIFRLNQYEEDFRKDEYAYLNYASSKLPIPRIRRIGRYDQSTFFAISERCPGTTLDLLAANETELVLPELFEALAAIHLVDVSIASGWGLMDARGRGQFDSWEEYLLSHHNQKFEFDLPELLRETFIEKAIFEEFHQEMKSLIRYCSPQKYLLHGDFGFDNAVVDGQRITGILDWADAGLGDFVYDIAYLDFWSKDVPLGDLWRNAARAQLTTVDKFEERMICYMLHVGLGSLIITGLTNDRRAYVRTRERTRSVLTPGRRRSSDWTQT